MCLPVNTLLVLTKSHPAGILCLPEIKQYRPCAAFGMNMQQAVDAPRMHHQWLPDVVTVEPGYLTPESQHDLEAKGYKIEERPAWGADEAIRHDPATGGRDPHSVGHGSC